MAEAKSNGKKTATATAGKGSPKSKATQSRGSRVSTGTKEHKAFRDYPEPPLLASKGADVLNTGKYYITICAPASDEELERTYCEITCQQTEPTPAGAVVTMDSGDIMEPFDGRMLRKGNLTAGTYVFCAKADYDNNDHVESCSSPITVP